MFKVEDLIIYSSHGVCHIDDICQRTVLGVTKEYYILHPLEDSKLKISIPVDNEKVNMLKLLEKEEAEEIIKLFVQEGTQWIDINNKRYEIYSQIIKTGNRREISGVINTLMKKKLETEEKGRKLYERDEGILSVTKNILFTELSMALNTTVEDIEERINGLISENLTDKNKGETHEYR